MRATNGNPHQTRSRGKATGGNTPTARQTRVTAPKKRAHSSTEQGPRTVPTPPATELTSNMPIQPPVEPGNPVSSTIIIPPPTTTATTTTTLVGAAIVDNEQQRQSGKTGTLPSDWQEQRAAYAAKQRLKAEQQRLAANDVAANCSICLEAVQASEMYRGELANLTYSHFPHLGSG